MSFRKYAHTDALNTISVLSDSFRNLVQSAESRSMNPVTTITINKSDLLRWTELSESTRIKLEKTEVNTLYPYIKNQKKIEFGFEFESKTHTKKTGFKRH